MPHRDTRQTVGLLNIHSLTCLSAGDLHLMTRLAAIAWQPNMDIKLLLIWQATVVASS